MAAFGSMYFSNSSTETSIPARCSQGSMCCNGTTREERYCGRVRASSFRDVPRYATSSTIARMMTVISNEIASTRGTRRRTRRCTSGLRITAINSARIKGTIMSAAKRIPARMITSIPSMMTIFNPFRVMMGFAMRVPELILISIS
ncbi:hypothetical protein D3C71_1259520 [compost metagenome]